MNTIMVKLKNKKEEASLFFIIILGLLLRLNGIGKPTLWFDEVASVHNAGKGIFQIIKAEINLPPLYNIFLHFWMLIFGKSEFAVRFPSVLFGIGIIFFVYKLTIRFFSKKTALLAAFIVAIAPYQVYYSQETRMYSLVTLLYLLSSYFFLKACDEKKNILWVLYIIFVTASFYTHYYALSLSCFHFLFLLLFWRDNKSNFYKWILCQIVIFLLFAYWIPIIFDSIRLGGIAWATWLLKKFGPLAQLGFIFFIFTLSYSAITYLPPQNLLKGINIFENMPFSGYLLIFTFGILVIICINLFKFYYKDRGKSFFIILYLCVPIFLAFLMFFLLKQQLTATKYLIVASPPYYILLAVGLKQIKNKVFRNTLFLSLVLIMVYSLYNYYYNPKFGKGQWSSVANYIELNAQKNDLIVIHKPYLDIALNYYYKGENKRYLLPISSSIDENEFMNNLRQDFKAYERVWLIIAHNFDTKLFYKDLFVKHFIYKDKKIFPVGYMVGIYLFDVK